MNERHAMRMKHERIAFIARTSHGASVEFVSQQGKAKRCEMYANLMLAACQKLDIE